MTAIEIVKHKMPEATPADLRYYVTLAESEVRAYLGYPEDKPLDKFAATVGEIACLIIDRESAVNAATESALAAGGVQSESYSESGVSRSVTYGGGGAGAAAREAYDSVIRQRLQNALSRYRLARVVKTTEDRKDDAH